MPPDNLKKHLENVKNLDRKDKDFIKSFNLICSKFDVIRYKYLDGYIHVAFSKKNPKDRFALDVKWSYLCTDELLKKVIKPTFKHQ